MTGYGDPIFVAGLSGSGKTQLRVGLSAHPELSLTRRTYLWTRFYGRFGPLDNGENLERALATVAGDPRCAQLEPDRERLRREILHSAPTYARLFGLMHAHHAHRQGKRRWGDQLGFVERFADPIMAEFPSARIVHMVRDPRRRPEQSKPTRQGRIGWETAIWLYSANLARRNAERFPDNYLVVHYETLATDRVGTLTQVCEFINEPVLDPMVDALHAVRLDSAGLTDPPAPTTEFVDRYTRGALHQLGYEAAPGCEPARPGIGYWLTEWPVNRSAMAGWRAVRRRALERQVERC